MPYLDRLFRFGGGASYALTGNRTLTAAECTPRFLAFTGTLGAPATVRLTPQDFDDWVIVNQTNQPLTVRAPTGDTVAVAAGRTIPVYYRASTGLSTAVPEGDASGGGAVYVEYEDGPITLTAEQSATSVIVVGGEPDDGISVTLDSVARGLRVLWNDCGEEITLVMPPPPSPEPTIGATVTIGVDEVALVAIDAAHRLAKIETSTFDPASPGPIGGTTAAAGTFTGLTVSGLTASRYVVTDGSKALASQSGVPLADLKNAGGAVGDLGVWNGSAWSRLVAVAQGQVLRSAGSGAAPDYGQIDNTHVSSSAAIAGTKISPAFGAQNITTTGTLSAGSSTLSAVNVTGLTASRYVVTDGSKNLASQQGVPLADLGNSGGAAGDVAYHNGTNWVRLAKPASDGKYALRFTGSTPSYEGEPYVYPTDGDTLLAWKFNESFGATTFVDSITGGAGRDMTVNSNNNAVFNCGISPTPHQVGSLYFTGTAGSSQLATGGTATPSASACSISCWANLFALQGGQLFYKRYYASGSNNGWNIPYVCFGLSCNSDNSLTCNISISGTLYSHASGVVVPLNRPSLLAATFDGSNVCIYMNGALAHTSARAGSIDWGSGSPAGGPWAVGQNTNGADAVKGAIWDCRVHNAVRNAAYWLAYYKAGMGLA